MILDFYPPSFLRSGHAQTIFAALWDSAKMPYAAQHHVVPTTENDKLVVHDDVPDGWNEGDRCALLIHGLGGSHQSAYMVRIAHKLNARGIRTFRMDQRGCGAGYRLATKPGHAGRSEDVRAALEFVTNSCPNSPIVLVGFSLGGNLALKMLGEVGANAPSQLLRAMAVAPPIDLLACSRNIERRGMAMYNRWFVRALVQQAQQRGEFIRELLEFDWTKPPKTLFEFDDRLTAPLSGFQGAHEYYTCSSSRELLAQIRVPTLVLTAADDPIVPVHIFESVQPTDSVKLHITRHGGHCGFFGRPSADPDRYWMDWRVVEYVMRD